VLVVLDEVVLEIVEEFLVGTGQKSHRYAFLACSACTACSMDEILQYMVIGTSMFFGASKLMTI
jgi:hypothetical protein